MADFSKLPLWGKRGLAHVVVETRKDARVKNSYEPALSCFVMSHALPVGLAYLYDWGFLPSTLGDDGDPLDVMIIHDAPTSPGLVIPCRVIGALMVEQQEKKGKVERNDRFIAMPGHDAREDLQDARDLPKKVKFEIEKFFNASIVSADKKINFLGWAGPKQAHKLIRAGEAAFTKSIS